MKRAMLLCLVCLVAVLTLLAASPGSAFALTGDGGWLQQYPPVQPSDVSDLKGVSFPDASHGWAVGYWGTILATADGGVHWTAQDSGGGAWLSGVSFPDASHGWAVGSGGILATSDGGAHWTKCLDYSNSGTTVDLSAVSFPDASHGWAVGTDWVDDPEGPLLYAVILATTDGGAHWAEQHPNSGIGDLRGVSFPDAGHGWAVGYGEWPWDPYPYQLTSTIWHCGDGAIWTAQSWGLVGDPHGVSFPDASHGWVVGGGGAIFATTDGGADWTAQNSGTTAYLSAVSFPDASHGWAVGSGGTILATSDGGATWTAQNSGTTVDLSAVSFPDASHGWVVGSGGMILATTNGGWPDSTPPTTTISGADDLWHNGDVSLTLTASDPGAHASDVDFTEYSLDDGTTWTKGTSVTVPAPADHSNDGAHIILYRSVDNAGNTEDTKSCTVKIDTTKPVISSAYVGFLRHSAHTGRCNRTGRFGLTCRIDDNLSPTATVTLEALNFRGKVVQTISVGECPTGVRQTCRLPGKLSLLFCRWRVTATDLAGNSQSKLARFRWFVRR